MKFVCKEKGHPLLMFDSHVHRRGRSVFSASRSSGFVLTTGVPRIDTSSRIGGRAHLCAEQTKEASNRREDRGNTCTLGRGIPGIVFKLASLASLAVNFVVLEKALGPTASVSLLLILGAHELGHLMVARRFHVPVLWPVFLPWIGAFVVLLKPPRNEKEGAWIGIGGPVAGVGATVCIHALGFLFKSEDLFDAAVWGYMVHLANLIPAGNLDGGHIAGFLARWMWVPGMVCLALVLHFIDGLNWASKLLIGLCCLSALFKAGVYVLECTGLKARPHEEHGFKGARRLMWLLLAIILGTCVVGLPIAKMQSLRMTNAELTVPPTQGGERLQGDGADAGVPTSAEK